MKTIYLDHNGVDGFDKGENSYLGPLLANSGCVPIVSTISLDEIFRGKDVVRATQNVESLKKLGVRHMYFGSDDSTVSIGELDFDNIYQNWLKMDSATGPLLDAHALFMSSLFSERGPYAIESMERATNEKIAWIEANYEDFPHVQSHLDKIVN